jgi:hypothetical protein
MEARFDAGRLAKMVGIERTYLARIETGDKVPSVRLQRDIQERLVRYESDKKLGQRAGFSDQALPPRLQSRNIPVVSWAAAG